LPASADNADTKLFNIQKSFAEKGDSKAQYYFGEMHEYGLGTAPSLPEAFSWYGKSAAQGNVLAKRKIAMRSQIETEFERDRILLERATRKEEVTPVAEPTLTAPKTAPRAAPVAKPQETTVAKLPNVNAEDLKQQQEIKAAQEREKRRQSVLRQMRERLANPIGEAFE
jgi:TPR repeat protein